MAYLLSITVVLANYIVTYIYREEALISSIRCIRFRKRSGRVSLTLS